MKIVSPSRWLPIFQWLAGSCDTATGVLLVFAPAWTLKLMGVQRLPQPVEFASFVGVFVLAAIAAVFGFVYWLHNTGGLGPRTTYHVQFEGSVPGLLVGAAVLFNGIRVGEVTELSLAPDNPRRVNAAIAVTSITPVRVDTKVGLEFQGLTGVPVITLEGRSNTPATWPPSPGGPPVLNADPAAGQSMTQAARDALRRVDSVLSENSEPLRDTIVKQLGDSYQSACDARTPNSTRLSPPVLLMITR